MKDENIIFLKPYFDDTKLWGGTLLKKYGYKGLSNYVGEAFMISALKEKSSYLLNEEYQGCTLHDFFRMNPSWFNNYLGEYPTLSKLIDAKEKLSIQVHPNDEYAKTKYNKLGKLEYWYILNCDEDASVVYGLKQCSNIQELKDIVKNNKLMETLNFNPIQKNDVIEVSPGTLHAINENIFLFEIQQSSDLTFRMYDYDRIDVNSNTKRKLHINECFDVINFKVNNNSFKNITEGVIADNSIFKTTIFNLENETTPFYFEDTYWIEIVIFDIKEAFINEHKLEIGTSLIIKNKMHFKISGTIKFSLTIIKKNNM